MSEGWAGGQRHGAPPPHNGSAAEEEERQGGCVSGGGKTIRAAVQAVFPHSPGLSCSFRSALAPFPGLNHLFISR